MKSITTINNQQFTIELTTIEVPNYGDLLIYTTRLDGKLIDQNAVDGNLHPMITAYIDGTITDESSANAFGLKDRIKVIND